jgi:multiple sugar transport system ATP-binding protein
MVHFQVGARPALTDDVRELAEDVGDLAALERLEEGAAEAVIVGRFAPRSGVREGERVDVAVDTSGLHFFDRETGLGIYG